MFGITDRTSSNAILSTFDALGIKPPKPVASAYEKAAKLTEEASRLGAERGSLEAALVAAILAGRDVHTDPAVQAAVTASYLSSNVNLGESVAAAGAEAIREACLANLDTIVAAWATQVDRAAATLAAAYSRIGDVLLSESAAILSRGGDIADVWVEAQTAERTIDQALTGWSSLMQFVRFTPNPEHRALRLASLSLDQWRTLPHKATAWDVVRAGLTPSLPTLDEYRARTARLERDRATESAEAVPMNREREVTKDWTHRVESARRSSPETVAR